MIATSKTIHVPKNCLQNRLCSKRNSAFPFKVCKKIFCVCQLKITFFLCMLHYFLHAEIDKSITLLSGAYLCLHAALLRTLCRAPQWDTSVPKSPVTPENIHITFKVKAFPGILFSREQSHSSESTNGFLDNRQRLIKSLDLQRMKRDSEYFFFPAVQLPFKGERLRDGQHGLTL